MSAASERMYHELNAIAVELNSNTINGLCGEKRWGHRRAVRHGVPVDGGTDGDRYSSRRTGTGGAGQPESSSFNPPGARCPRCGR
ncbi:hypothetical protein AWC25_07845 [Mycobacterium sherrisii]|uniref:Uncharacterized protein n=1 Tax=Mycobacterium sherrisii TaxID=243061 RepID=A0A1E3T2G3_9MYCO|nr:hypothetical protein BHQ21_07935 [Mycobacterium sherrisii]ORW77879.1 hypothetical protein AWC25_07845 [Mycobacterium sherrisii]